MPGNEPTICIFQGDCRSILAVLPPNSVNCVVTSPPYFGLRDYGVAGQIGLEASLDAYVAELVAVFREVRRVLRPDGTLWLNLGDSYTSGGRSTRAHDDKSRAREMAFRADTAAGLKPKDLMMVPHRVAIALQADGWWVRQDIVWHKPNPMPESVTDRCTKAHEYLFLLTKSERYFFDAEAIREEQVKGAAGSEFHTGKTGEHQLGRASRAERVDGAAPGRNKRSVWTIAPKPFKEAHFATFPPALVEPCILAGCPVGGVVLDPFSGAGTTALVAKRLGRSAIGIELNPDYVEMSRLRIARG